MTRYWLVILLLMESSILKRKRIIKVKISFPLKKVKKTAIYIVTEGQVVAEHLDWSGNHEVKDLKMILRILDANRRWWRVAAVNWGHDSERRARSRATISDHLSLIPRLYIYIYPRSCSILMGYRRGRRAPNADREHERSLRRHLSHYQIIHSHWASSIFSQRDHNVLLFDPHFVSDLTLTAGNPWRSCSEIWSTSHDLFSRGIFQAMDCGNSSRLRQHYSSPPL